MTVGSSKQVVTCSCFLDEKREICALVVDDDPLVRKIHNTFLTRYGLKIDAVENGKEAVDLFASGKYYDLVLMDMEMPVMDGLQATHAIRAMGMTCMIVGVTACHVESEKQAFIEAGLDSCWEKPLTIETVLAILDELAVKLL